MLIIISYLKHFIDQNLGVMLKICKTQETFIVFKVSMCTFGKKMNPFNERQNNRKS